MSFSLSSLTLLAVASLSLATPLSTSPYDPSQRYPDAFSVAPLHVPRVQSHELLNNSYIVMFKDNVPFNAFDAHFNFLNDAHSQDPLEGEESGLKHVWDSHVKGYAGHFTKDVIDMIRRQPEVAYVEHDQMVYALDLDTQKNAPWVRFSSAQLNLLSSVLT